MSIKAEVPKEKIKEENESGGAASWVCSETVWVSWETSGAGEDVGEV
jgi:hypothetical protein